MAKKKTKAQRLQDLEFEVTTAVILIIAICLGFVGGLYYAHHASNGNSTNQLQTIPKVCSCPMIPAGASTTTFCRC